MKYYSAIKMNKILTHGLTYMNLEHIMLNKVSQAHKDN